VCAFGVGCLYLVPSVARLPDETRSRVADDQPIPSSATQTPVLVQSTGPAVTDSEESRSLRQRPEPSPTQPPEIAGRSADFQADTTSRHQTSSSNNTAPPPGLTTSQDGGAQQRQPSPSGATAFDPEENKSDDTAPDPVRGIKFGPVNPDDLTVRWSAGHDDTGVVGYRVWLDGFLVATTTETRATVNWFNDDMGQHVVQVKALDAAGNQSKTAEIVLVDRPPSAPSETTSAKPRPKPSATASPDSASQSADSP
jgi:hypothetical protein